MKFLEIIKPIFEIVSEIWLVISIIVFFIDRRINIRELFNRFMKRPVDYTFQNDKFAKNTIRYRFLNIICNINEKYEDAAVKLKIDKNDFERPLDYDLFYYEKFPKLNYSNILADVKDDKEKEQDRQLLEEFYDKYYQKYKNERNHFFLENEAFIDVEHAFYFYILDKMSGLPSNIKTYICDGASGVFDPYKLDKKKAIIKDINKGFPDSPTTSNNNSNNNEFSRILYGLEVVNQILKKEFVYSNKFKVLLSASLDSNTCDLSQLRGKEWHITNIDNEDSKGINEFIKYITAPETKFKCTSVNYLVDNAGIEFFIDLVVGFALLNNQEYGISKITYHVNVLPIFVSDVIGSDLRYTLKTIYKAMTSAANIQANKKDEYRDALRALAKMFIREKGGKPSAVLEPDFIWNMPTAYEDISRRKSVFSEESSLLIVKGDLNYRRLCRDKSWHYTCKLNKLTQYISSPTLVIRSFKSNVILDYTEKRVEEKKKENKEWRTTGKYGTILFMKKKG